MKLKLVRSYLGSKYTIGHLYINDQYFCDTIEDIDRNLNSSMSKQEIAKIKVKHQTAIPYGTYNITMKVVSPKYSAKEKFKFTGGRMPRLLSVSGFDGILIHPGTTQEDSSGCIIVGLNKQVGKVLDSYNTFVKLWNILEKANKAGESITLIITKNTK